MDNNSIKEFKIAVDLGTTSVELAIIGDNKDIIDRCYFNNPQSLYGKDVITRINTATRNKSFIKIMKDLLVASLKEHLYKLISTNHLNISDFSKICICGNTTMISILLENDLEELGSFPFNHKLNKSIIINSEELFDDDFILRCPVILSGCSSAFIGGDVLAGLYYVEKEYDIKEDETYLFLDLGTNGEMVLYNKGDYYSTSCACGPAFEASSRSENVYGSTLIDAIALGRMAGKISKNGILEDRFIQSGLNIMGVNLSADKLREILLAKAAIKTGIDILVKESNTNIPDITEVYVAGGFGFYLNIDHATYIGLIPDYLKDKVKVLGNTSLKGAIMLLTSNDYIVPIDLYIEKDIKLIQMANLPDYQELLINNMYF